MKDSELDFSKLNFSNLKFLDFKMPKVDIPDYGIYNEELFESINRDNREKHKREVENNNSLKSLVKYNEDISNYNRELVSLNEKILNKINSLDDTLTFLNDAFSDKVKKDNKNSEQQLSLLLELITIIESKDSSKLKTFMSNVGSPVAVGLLIEALKIKFGLG